MGEQPQKGDSGPPSANGPVLQHPLESVCDNIPTAPIQLVMTAFQARAPHSTLATQHRRSEVLRQLSICRSHP